MRVAGWRGGAAALGFVAAAAVAVHGYRNLESPEPLVLAALALAWAGGFSLACAGAGWHLTRRLLGTGPRAFGDWVVVLLAGSGVLTGAAWVLSLVRLLRPVPLLAVLVAAAVCGALVLRRSDEPDAASADPGRPLLVLCLVVGGATLLTAATLSPFYDQWHYQLAFPYQWLRHGTFVPFPRNDFSYIPANLGFLYTYPLASVGPWGAQVVHWWMGVMTVMGAASLASRLRGPEAGRWAALVALTTPTLIDLSSRAATDLGVAAYGVGAWLVLARLSALRADEQRSAWLLVGAFMGLAAGCKYIGLASVGVPVTAAAVLLGWQARKRFGTARALTSPLLVLAAGAATFAPWAVRNLVLTGNPLYPYAGSVFAPLMRTAAEHTERVAQWIAGYTLTWEHVWAGRDLTVLSWPPDGAPPLGPLYLVLLPVTALFLARRLDLTRRALVLGGVVGIALWLPGFQSSRYLLPALVPVIPLLADGVVQLLASLSRPARRLVVAMLVFLAAWNLQVAVAPVEVNRLAATLGQRPVDGILDRWVSSWPAVRWINANLPEDAHVLLVAEARSLLLDRDVVLEQAIHEPLLVELAESEPSAGAMARALADRGITHVLFNRQEARRMLEMAGGEQFLETSSAAADERLRQFFADWLEELWQQGGVSVYRLRKTPAEVNPGVSG